MKRRGTQGHGPGLSGVPRLFLAQLGDPLLLLLLGAAGVSGLAGALSGAGGWNETLALLAVAVLNAGAGTVLARRAQAAGEPALRSQRRLRRELARLSAQLSKGVLAVCALVFVGRLLSTGAAGPGAVPDAFLCAVSLAVAAIPEGLVTVVTAVRAAAAPNPSPAEERRILHRIRRAVQFLLASNLAEVLGVFAATLLGFTLLRPVHLLCVNLVTDCFPALALGMEPPSAAEREPRGALLTRRETVDILYQGVLLAALTLLAYGVGGARSGRTMAFLTLSLGEVFHAFNLRSPRGSLFALRRRNPALWATLLGALALTALVLTVPPLASALDLAPVGWRGFAAALGLGAAVIPLVEGVKCLQRLGPR